MLFTPPFGVAGRYCERNDERNGLLRASIAIGELSRYEIEKLGTLTDGDEGERELDGAGPSLKAYEPRSGASYARLPCYEQNEHT